MTTGTVKEVEVRWMEMYTMGGDDIGNDGVEGYGLVVVGGRVEVVGGGDCGRSSSSGDKHSS